MHIENQVLSESIDFLVILVSFDFVVVLCSLDCLDLFSLFCLFVVVVVFYNRTYACMEEPIRNKIKLNRK